jgi:hypothetical protein
MDKNKLDALLHIANEISKSLAKIAQSIEDIKNEDAGKNESKVNEGSIYMVDKVKHVDTPHAEGLKGLAKYIRGMDK